MCQIRRLAKMESVSDEYPQVRVVHGRTRRARRGPRTNDNAAEGAAEADQGAVVQRPSRRCHLARALGRT
jgi:hypothetical protein